MLGHAASKPKGEGELSKLPSRPSLEAILTTTPLSVSTHGRVTRSPDAPPLRTSDRDASSIPGPWSRSPALSRCGFGENGERPHPAVPALHFPSAPCPILPTLDGCMSLRRQCCLRLTLLLRLCDPIILYLCDRLRLSI